MASTEQVLAIVEQFFDPKMVKVNDSYDLTKLDLETRCLQVREVAHRAPKDQAKRYSEQMNHNPFPAIVVTMDDYLVDGYTRTVANGIRKITVFPAIVINIKYASASVEERARVNALCATLNASHGNGLTSRESRHAIRYYLDSGFSTEKISKNLGVSERTVSDVRREIEAENKLAKLGFENVKDFATDTVKKALGNQNILALNDEPFRKLAELTQAANLNATEVGALGKLVKDTGSDADALEVLRNAFEENTGRIRTVSLTGKVGSPSPAAQFRKVLGGITKFSTTETTLLEADPAQAEVYVAQIKIARDVLDRLLTLQAA